MLHTTIKNKWVRLLAAAAGAVLCGLGVNLFLVPLNLYTGGILGVCQLLRTLIYQALGITDGYDFSGILYYLVNIPIFLMGFRSLGKDFFRSSLLCVTVYTGALSLVPIPSAPLVADLLTGCLLGGAIVGLGSGIMLTYGASCGGTDMPSLCFAKRGARFTIGRVNIVFNGILYGLCGILFSVETMIYSILYIVFCSVVLDRVHQQSINVQMLIFTKNHAVDLSDYILQHLHRGVTWWDGQGVYTGEKVKIICVCLSKYEINDLREELHRQDPHAFYIVQEGVHLSDNFIRRLSE